MSITVKFLASLAEQFTASELTIEITNPQTIESVWQQATGDQQMPQSILSAINFNYAQASDLVKNGDEVAFFPPVTGG